MLKRNYSFDSKEHISKELENILSEKLLTFNSDSSVIDNDAKTLDVLKVLGAESSLLKKYGIKSCHPKTKDDLQNILNHVFDVEGKDYDLDLNWIDVSQMEDMSLAFARLDTFNCDISEWDVSNVKDMFGMFNDCKKFDQDLSAWDVSNVKSMEAMFSGCTNFNQDISSWDVSNVENMRSMFLACHNFNQDLSEWNVSNVKNMGWMFANCEKFNQDLSNWNVSNVTAMADMFNGCYSFNQDISRWNVSNVTNMMMMFQLCKAFNQDISKWNVSNVTNMRAMFRRCENFNQDLGGWDVSNVEIANEMFYGCINFNQDISKWNVSNFIDTSFMFAYCKNFNQDLSSWDLSSFAVYTSGMFSNCPISFKYKPKLKLSEKLLTFNSDSSVINKETESTLTDLNNIAEEASKCKKYGIKSCHPKKREELLKILNSVFEVEGRDYDLDLNWIDVSQMEDMDYMFYERETFNCDISKWDVSNVKYMASMFRDCTNFNQDISKWNVSNVKDMFYMFFGCSNFNCDISNWDVSNVKSMTFMFGHCLNFNQDLNKWNISKELQSTAQMFKGCERFNCDLNNWDVSNIESMYSMFENCIRFNGDISNWDVSRVANMSFMFNNCRSFNRDISRWDVSKVYDMSNMFQYCVSFNQDLNKWNVSLVHKTYHMFYGCKNFNQDLSNWNVSNVENAREMFYGCINFDQDLSKWDLSGAKDIGGMFIMCPILMAPKHKPRGVFRDVFEKLLRFDSDSSMFDKETDSTLANLNNIAKEASICKKYNIKSTHPKDRDELIDVLYNVFEFEHQNHDLDLNWIDVSQVNDMSWLFRDLFAKGDFDSEGAYFLEHKTFNCDISKWNVSNVRNMHAMFWGCRDFNQDISNWNVSNVTSMNNMFNLCKAFNSDISKWNVSKVEYMGGMFVSCSSFNQDLSNWDVSNVKDMMSLFNGCLKFNSDISGWDISHVYSMSFMFRNCRNFNQDLSNWDISHIPQSYRISMFLDCPISPNHKPKVKDIELTEKLLTFSADSSVIDAVKGNEINDLSHSNSIARRKKEFDKYYTIYYEDCDPNNPKEPKKSLEYVRIEGNEELIKKHPEWYGYGHIMKLMHNDGTYRMALNDKAFRHIHDIEKIKNPKTGEVNNFVKVRTLFQGTINRTYVEKMNMINLDNQADVDFVLKDYDDMNPANFNKWTESYDDISIPPKTSSHQYIALISDTPNTIYGTRKPRVNFINLFTRKRILKNNVFHATYFDNIIDNYAYVNFNDSLFATPWDSDEDKKEKINFVDENGNLLFDKNIEPENGNLRISVSEPYLKDRVGEHYSQEVLDLLLLITTFIDNPDTGERIYAGNFLKKDKKTFLFKNLEKIAPNYELFAFGDKFRDYATIKKNEYQGTARWHTSFINFIDVNGKLFSPIWFSEAFKISKNDIKECLVEDPNYELLVVMDKDGKYNLFDNLGHILSPDLWFDKIVSGKSTSPYVAESIVAFFIKENGENKYNYFNIKTKEILCPDLYFTNALPFSKKTQRGTVFVKNDKYFIDKNGVLYKDENTNDVISVDEIKATLDTANKNANELTEIIWFKDVDDVDKMPADYAAKRNIIRKGKIQNRPWYAVYSLLRNSGPLSKDEIRYLVWPGKTGQQLELFNALVNSNIMHYDRKTKTYILNDYSLWKPGAYLI